MMRQWPRSLYDASDPEPTPSGADDIPENRSLPPLFSQGQGVLDDELPLRDLPFSARAYDAIQESQQQNPEPTRYRELVGITSGSDSTLRTAIIHSIRNNSSNTRRGQWHEIIAMERALGRSNERTGTTSQTMTEMGGMGESSSSRSRPEWDREGSSNRARSFRSRMDTAVGAASGRNSTLPSASTEIEGAIDYLSKIRACHTAEESLRLAVRAGFNNAEDWLELFDHPRCADILLNTMFLGAAETSWLKAGGVFWGTQTTPTLSFLSNTSTGSNTNRWNVKVIISSVDYSQMRLTGTMEAFTDVQQNSLNPPNNSSITTYLEGEIIDFNKHTFLTSNFRSSLKDDANNWRKLEPFVHMTNADVVRCLFSRKFMKDLTDEWVFMRWKEKCFISPQTDPNLGGLTIGGFYFLALRRDNGVINGFYHDPKSQPYQELTLKPQKRFFPTYEFR